MFGGAGGKFGQQGPQGPRNNPGGWNKVQPQGKGGLFGFVNTEAADGTAGGEQAEVMLKAMVAAAQADGRIDEAEQRNVIQALEGQLDSSEMEGLRKFLTTPISMDEVVEAVDDPATAFNLYLVSAMTINPDNPQEKAYMAALADKLGISEQAAQVVEAQLPR
ncbi:tellurite resistance TerB family protein [Microbulbifer agarilyticus]|nr:tellurite resistance TerB family protein [Microbulbifer agarilyticus]